jgi:hypothetical protein
MVTVLYLKHLIDTSGDLEIDDIGITVGISSLLFYAVSILGKLDDFNKLNYLHFVDLISISMCLGMYVKRIKYNNDRSAVRTSELNTKSKEACGLNKIKSKEMLPELQYPNINMILLISIIPYFLLF